MLRKGPSARRSPALSTPATTQRILQVSHSLMVRPRSVGAEVCRVLSRPRRSCSACTASQILECTLRLLAVRACARAFASALVSARTLCPRSRVRLRLFCWALWFAHACAHSLVGGPMDAVGHAGMRTLLGDSAEGLTGAWTGRVVHGKGQSDAECVKVMITCMN